jgi:hypothetical protein
VLVIDTTWWRLVRCDTCLAEICDTFISNKCYAWFAIDPDSVKFPTDSVHIDSTDLVIGSVDRTGTLVQNWDVVRTQSPMSNGGDLIITAYADDIGKPGTPAPIAPQQGGVLIKLLADILPVPDTLQDRRAELQVQTGELAKIIFSAVDGTAINISDSAAERTNCWRCTDWLAGVCVDSSRYSLPPCEWYTIDTIQVPYLDTSKIWIYDGSITAEEYTGCCVDPTGNVNFAGIVDGSDLALLVAYLTNPPGTKPPLPCPAEANVNAAGIIDGSDLALLVAYLTNPPGSKPALPACPPE